MGAGVLHDGVGHAAGLGQVQSLALVHAVGDELELQAPSDGGGLRAGEGVQVAIVEGEIREGDERLVQAAVVPLEPAGGDARAQVFLEHALGVFVERQPVFIHRRVRLAAHNREEVGGRQLLRIAHDDELPAAKDRAEGVFGGKLGGLVEYDQIEARRAAVEELGHRKGAHEEARFDGANGGLGVVHGLAQRAEAALAGHLAAQEGHRGGGSGLLQALLYFLAQLGHQRDAVLAQHPFVELAELGHALLVRDGVEDSQRLARLHHLAQPLLIEGARVGGGQRLERHIAIHGGRQQLGRPATSGRGPRGLEHRPARRLRQAVEERPNALGQDVEGGVVQVIGRPANRPTQVGQLGLGRSRRGYQHADRR